MIELLILKSPEYTRGFFLAVSFNKNLQKLDIIGNPILMNSIPS